MEKAAWQKKLEEAQKRAHKATAPQRRAKAALAVAGCVVTIAIVVGIVWIVIHFIVKYW